MPTFHVSWQNGIHKENFCYLSLQHLTSNLLFGADLRTQCICTLQIWHQVHTNQNHAEGESSLDLLQSFPFPSFFHILIGNLMEAAKLGSWTFSVKLLFLLE